MPLAVDDARRLDRGTNARLAVGDLAVPGDVDVTQPRTVLERYARGIRADRAEYVLSLNGRSA